MDEDWKELIAELIVLIIMVVMVFLVGGAIGARDTREDYQKQAIEKGFAEYDSVTGEWKWKEK